MDSIRRLGMDDRNRQPSKKPEGHQALFTIGEPIILEREGWTLKDPRGIDKVEAVCLQIRSTLTFVPREAHRRIVYTVMPPVKELLSFALTPKFSGRAQR